MQLKTVGLLDPVDAALNAFGALLQVVQAPVVPMALTDLWGSFFSRIEQVNGERVAMVRPFRRGLFSRVGLNVGPPLMPDQVQPDALRARIEGLLARRGELELANVEDLLRTRNPAMRYRTAAAAAVPVV